MRKSTMVYISVSQNGFREGVSGVPRDENANGGRVLLTVQNLYVRV